MATAATLYDETEKEAAEAIVGIVLRWPEQLHNLALDDRCFYNPKLRAIVKAARALAADKEPIDEITLSDRLDRDGVPVSPSDLTEYSNKPVSSGPLRHYASILEEGAITRDVLGLANDLHHLRSTGLSGSELLGALVSRAGAIADRSVLRATEDAGSVALERAQQLLSLWERKADGEEITTGAPTGVTALDERIGGYPYGIFSLIAGRPGMGKSSLGMAAAFACARAGRHALVFSVEETRAAYSDRIIAQLSGVSVEKLGTLSFTDEEAAKVSKAYGELAKLNTWHLDTRSGITVEDVVTTARAARAEHGVELVVVDMVGRLRPSDPRHDERQHLDHCANVLGDAAKHDNIAYVGLAHLNRECEGWENKKAGFRPRLNHIRMSDSFGMNCKVVVFPYRPWVYWKRGQLKGQEPDMSLMEILVAKCNQGREGRVKAKFNGPTCKVW